MMRQSDLKILKALLDNCRLPNSAIATIVNLHRDTVARRIERMQNEGIIDKFYITAFKNAIGILRYSELFVKGRFSDEQIAKIACIPEASRILTLDGYLWITLNSPTSMRTEKVLSEIKAALGKAEYQNVTVSMSRYLARRFLADAPPNHIRVSAKGAFQKELTKAITVIPQGILNLDETSLKILDVLRSHARISLVELSESVGINRETAEHKIKELITKGVIRYFTTNIRYENIGLQKFFIALQVSDKKKIREYIAANPNGFSYYEFTSKWDIGFEIILRDSKDAVAYVDELYREFGSAIHAHELFIVLKEHKLESFPPKIFENYMHILKLLP